MTLAVCYRSGIKAALAVWLLTACARDQPTAITDRVGRQADYRGVTPVNQTLTPHGSTIDLPGLRPQALALAPDRTLLAVSGKTSEVLILDPGSGNVRQRVALPSQLQRAPSGADPNKLLEPDQHGQISYTGLVFSPDGRRLYLSNVDGSIKVFTVTGGVVAPLQTLPLPRANAPRRAPDIPSGLALTDDGSRLWVCLNLSNRLAELDAASGDVLRLIDVGVAPYDVVLVSGKAFVSNWGGRRPTASDLVGPAGRGTTVRVDPVRHIASEGSVSVVDLASGTVVTEILTGLHACALAASPDGRYVACANAGSDHISVLDVGTNALVETIWVKPGPAELFGASPNALAFTPDGKTLYAANGTQNAVAVVRFAPDDRASELLGLIPVGWFPAALAYDPARAQLLVANLKGLTTGRERQDRGPEYNSHQHHGSITRVPVPSIDELPKLSQRVDDNLRRATILASRLPPRPGQPPRPVPERIGEPSVFEHVVYVIKENRTYDQVLGDLPQGNGDPTLCTFGEDVTPNQHAIARQFVLLDNTYCAGILSADGHQWSTTAFATDYLEKSFAGFPRSYPDGMGEDEDDALAYSPAGFLWDHVLAKGLTFRDYGEFAAPKVRWRDPLRSGAPDFLACYRAWQTGNDEVIFASEPMVETLRPFAPTGYVGWEMAVPDQYRADFFLRELREFEQRGDLPALTIICLPNDHTSGTKAGCPTPAACIADNDLAFGRIVEGLSQSRFWPRTVILAIEDDPQAGWDHVSGYRTTAYCVSPYTRRGVTVSTQYNTTSILRTIEQILGIAPMNQFDASATPMFDCFTATPDWTGFTAVPNRVPLDQMNPEPSAIADPVLRQDAVVSAGLDWSGVDRVPEGVLNGILWRSAKGGGERYPEGAGQGLRR